MTSASNTHPRTRARASGQRLPPFVVVGFVLFMAAISGAALGLFGGELGIFLFITLAGLALLSAPRAAVWAVVIGGLVVAGLVQLYLPGLQTVRWAFAFMSIALGMISAVNWLANVRRAPASSQGTAPLVLALLLFIAAVLVAALAGGIGMVNAVIGLKNYFQMWGLILALAWLGYKPMDARRFVLAFGFLAVIQLPFALHQFLVLVPQRSGAADALQNVVAVDIVAGTFGGDMAAGGRSADLAILAAIAITLFFAQWKLGFRRLGSALFFSALAFSPMLLNEAKLALVLLPLGLLLLFRTAIIRKPFAWTLGAVMLVSCLTTIVYVYSILPGADSQRSKSIGAFMSSAMETNIGERGYGSAVLNRSTVYRFWWRAHSHSEDVAHTLFGHGPGFANASAINRGDVPKATQYRGYAIGLTGISTLLWDTGLFGAGTFLGVLLMTYRLGGRVAQKWQGTVHEPTVLAAQISVVLFATSLLHNEYVAFDIGFQTMLALAIGYLFAMAKAAREPAA